MSSLQKLYFCSSAKITVPHFVFCLFSFLYFLCWCYGSLYIYMHALPGTHVSRYDKPEKLLHLACVFGLLCTARLIHIRKSFDSYALSRLCCSIHAYVCKETSSNSNASLICFAAHDERKNHCSKALLNIVWWRSREAREEPEERPGRQGDSESLRDFSICLVLLVFFIALPWLPCTSNTLAQQVTFSSFIPCIHIHRNVFKQQRVLGLLRSSRRTRESLLQCFF